ncbi:MAG TPA: bifunctional diaminohydroxyphosphoribosylaminopyrimidine deaminase/5-amino-6-(5-phosphoribosylamino)uracil reductase RibD [Candidatus Cloacimonadota bacterium]|nr:bifunctional diaminohydroxyphosphoribosylaminopyrimidine deaminase/5-amino-6-(5-phosphoribosylamino)uracil reductase RibD [Candidatus Cloacimonadota bacterium]
MMVYSPIYMEFAIREAAKGHYLSRPNPSVGAVVVENFTKVVGWGHSQAYGQDHAEVVALKMARDHAKGADLYVTLEPCCHYGKTSPCTKAIIDAGIKTVYIAMLDPNPLVSGKGVEELKKYGIKVAVGYMAEEVQKQLEYYLHFVNKNRPFVIMKNAISIDGKIATSNGESKWITNEKSRQDGRLLRTEVSAIITGIGTVLADDPMLNIREDDLKVLETTANKSTIKSPLRVVLDPHLKTPLDYQIVKTAKTYPTIIVASNTHIDNENKVEQLQNMGVEIVLLPSDTNGIDLEALLSFLAERKITAVLVECGAKLSSSFLKAKLVDKIYYYVSPKILGANYSVYSHLDVGSIDKAIELETTSIKEIEGDIRIEMYVKKSN